jgi:hypothetical protein
LYAYQTRPRVGGLACVRLLADGLAVAASRRRLWRGVGFAETISMTEPRSVSRSIVRVCDGSRQVEQIILRLSNSFLSSSARQRLLSQARSCWILDIVTNSSNYLCLRQSCTNGFKETRGYRVTCPFSSIANRIPLGCRS